MAYIGQGLDSDIQVNKYEYTATAGQTIFACTYDRAVDVYVNGVKLDSSDFTASNGTSITLTSGANAGDIVDINAYFDVTYFNIDNELPDQSGQSGKFLTTDGSNSSWIDVPPEITKSATAPTSPSNGDFWYDTNDFAFRFYDGTQWQLIKSAFTATGGSITQSGGFRYHTFTTSGTFEITKGSSEIQYLVVAGGGAGGGSDPGLGGGGGGGAGGMIIGTTSLGEGTYSIIVGSGGAGNFRTRGSSGGSTAFASEASCVGGGGGGDGDNGPASTGFSGGSGGGGGYRSYTTQANYGSGTSGQGNRGGGVSSTSASGGGGGGKGGVGLSNTGTGGGSGGQGGAGMEWEGTVYAAGGTGGNGTGLNGPSNTGNGGSGMYADSTGKNGGSGIVIIRYAA